MYLPYIPNCFTGNADEVALNAIVFLRLKALATDGVWKWCIGLRYTKYNCVLVTHDDVIKRKPFLRYWPFLWGIHRSPVNSPHRGQWRWAFIFCLICAWINSWVNNREAGDFRRHHVHYDVIVMFYIHARACCLMAFDPNLHLNAFSVWRHSLTAFSQWQFRKN